MNSAAGSLPHHHQVILHRCVAACQADARVVAAILCGSYAAGTADAYSDLDLGIITTDEAHQDFVAGRECFVRMLGEPLFLEDFNLPNSVFFILSDGTEGELALGRQSECDRILDGPYRVLLDKTDLLAGAVASTRQPGHVDQIETLRRLVYWFWHDLSHFATAMGRGQLWWAHGQLENLRLTCVNLARLRENFMDADVGEEGYFKLERAISPQHLTPLLETFCPQEPGAMLQAALVIVRYYRELATLLARRHGITYPAELDRMLCGRLQIWSDARAS